MFSERVGEGASYRMNVAPESHPDPPALLPESRTGFCPQFYKKCTVKP